MNDVLGRKVTGEVVRSGHNKTEQLPGEEFIKLLDDLLSKPNVESVRWRQYTPYFNDGEPCIFSVGEAEVKLIDEPNNPNEDIDLTRKLLSGDEYLSEYDMIDSSHRYMKPPIIKIGMENIYNSLIQLSSKMSNFEDFLQDTFGDHAVVTATTEGFDIEFYEHD